MGFSFRRSASFGPFRLNFSRSGIGASVGVKGARVTLTPRGKTYITVGAGGFSYRQNLSGTRSSNPRSSPEPVVAAQVPDTIQTADVEELRQSSKSELVENLNRRARMFNPAVLVFVLTGICAIIGFAQFASSAPPVASAFPDVSSNAESRQANQTDEYAVLLGRYGQPSAVTIAQQGNVAVRMAAWTEAHLTITFVPASCVDAYNFWQAHKNDRLPTHIGKNHRGVSHNNGEPTEPICTPPPDNATTIVGYQDTNSQTSIDSFAADQSMSSIITKSTAVPTVTVITPPQPKIRGTKPSALPAAVAYNEQTVEREQQRQRNAVMAQDQSFKTGGEWLGGSVLLLVPGVILHRKNKEKRMTDIVYELSEPVKAQLQNLEGALVSLTESAAIWRLDSQSAVSDWKRNAGASYNVKRERVGIRKVTPPRVETNVEPFCIDLGKVKMFFLPDQVLYWERGVFASMEYSDLRMEAGSTRFIEDSIQTFDSRQVGTTWRYVRKDGGPDRRFNNNQQLPIMLYGVVAASSSSGLNLVLHTSKCEAANSFTTTFRTFQTIRSRAFSSHELPSSSGKAASQVKTPARYPANILEAMKILDISPGASAEQIAVAYRHMAQMYHPDKTSGLGPELQSLAELKMKQINAAHVELKHFFGGV